MDLISTFFQLKKELSDALLAAEHERNNFRAEVRFYIVLYWKEYTVQNCFGDSSLLNC